MLWGAQEWLEGLGGAGGAVARDWWLGEGMARERQGP